MAIFSQLRRRRVPQFLGIYLGASWAVIQFVDWMVSRYLLSHHLTDIALIGLVSLTPAILLLAYYHGAPGRQELGRVGKIGVPLNVVVTVALVAMFLQGRDLSATARNVTVTDEDGQQVTRLVPKESARRKVALFFWANDSGDDDLEWLRHGMPLVLSRDLSQNPFIDAWTPYGGAGGGIFSRLVRAGYEDGLDAPVALQRKVASAWHLEHFVDGRFDRRDGQWIARIAVYRTDTGQPAAEHEVQAATIDALADALTVVLVEELDVPKGSDLIGRDLPAAEILTDDTEALRAFVAGYNALLMGNDLETAITAFQRAVEIDPTFATAQFLMGDSLFKTGNTEAADAALAAAQRHDYKLTEADRFQVKGYRYLLDNQVEKRNALFEMWVELHPTDVTALVNLASVYKWGGNRVAEAKAVFERILALHPVETWTLQEISALSLLEGDTEGAVEALARYADLHPDDHGVWLKMGAIERGQGKLEAAREAFEKASLMASGFVNPALQLADLAMRLGDLPEAEARLDEAADTAADATQEALVLRARIGFHVLRGQLDAAYSLLEPLEALHRTFQQSIDVFITVHINHVGIYHDTGRDAELEAKLEAAIETHGSPFDRFLGMGSMMLAITRDDADAAERHRRAFEDTLTEWKREDFRFLTEMVRGQELDLRGRHDEAISAFEHALTLYRGSVQSNGEDSLVVELQRRIAIAQRKKGDFDAARTTLGEALALMPALPTLHLELAKIADADGDADQTRAHAEKALTLWAVADSAYPPAAEARTLAAR